MQLIGSYPLTESVVTPYIGQPVVAEMQGGDRFAGTVVACEAGCLYLEPCNPATAPSAAAVQGLTKKISNYSKVKKFKDSNKANIKLWGYGYGLGAAFALPLLAIALLFTAPFFI